MTPVVVVPLELPTDEPVFVLPLSVAAAVSDEDARVTVTITAGNTPAKIMTIAMHTAVETARRRRRSHFRLSLNFIKSMINVFETKYTVSLEHRGLR